MNYLVYVQDGVVHEILETNNPLFEGVPIEDRYSTEYLSHCVQVSDEQLDGIVVGMLYDADAQIFSYPTFPQSIPPEDEDLTKDEDK